METVECKTSIEWVKELNDGVQIYDPDGWDRSNFTYSFMIEQITKEEFLARRQKSTCVEITRGD